GRRAALSRRLLGGQRAAGNAHECAEHRRRGREGFHRSCGGATGVPAGVPEEPANTERPSASVIRAALAVFEPSLARYASTVISSPGFSERLLQPSLIKPFGFDVSIIHCAVLPF